MIIGNWTGNATPRAASQTLPHEFASRLNPYVQGKFIELWEALAQAGEE
jgi:hypothetical protein